MRKKEHESIIKKEAKAIARAAVGKAAEKGKQKIKKKAKAKLRKRIRRKFIGAAAVAVLAGGAYVAFKKRDKVQSFIKDGELMELLKAQLKEKIKIG